jgi:light-regulated signal transduction histidine kinase (bacteriophytochrome)
LAGLLGLRPGEHGRIEIELVGFDGPLLAVLAGSCLDIGGTLVRCLIATDLTTRKQVERELAERAAALQAANRELGRSNDELEQLAYVASHDLSEPLRAISGPLTLLATRYRGKLDEEAEEFIGFAVDGCRRLQAMIDDLLVFSRVGRVERPFEAIDLNETLDHVLAVLGPSLHDAGATVRVEPLPMVFGEATQMMQLFQNLIANAVKFVRPGVAPEVSVGAERRGGEWWFSVTDNGIGIRAQDRARIFGMFKRLHRREEYAGTGIGLALGKKIVEHHGGRIGVDDNPDGPGSRFWFTLPTAEALAA